MRRRRLWGSGLVLLLVAGCAPAGRPQLPRLGSPSIEARFEARLAERRAHAGFAEGNYSAWVHRPSGQDPPGLTLRTRLVAPDAFRFRVDALFGNAVDLSGHGDTLVIDAPALNLTAVTDAGGDRSRRQDISGWVCRALAATWSPPASAWAQGEAADSAWRVRWTEAEDSLELVVSMAGLPRTVRVHPAGGSPIALGYERWQSWNGVMWPARLVAKDDEGRLSVTLQPESMRLMAHDATAATALRIPDGALRLSRSRLRAWVSRIAGEATADTSR